MYPKFIFFVKNYFNNHKHQFYSILYKYVSFFLSVRLAMVALGLGVKKVLFLENNIYHKQIFDVPRYLLVTYYSLHFFNRKQV